MTACPSEDQLVRMVEGVLTAEALAAIEQHVDGCAACAAVIADLGALATDARPRTIDRYQLDRRIAAGGMGEVWAAWDPKLHREIAVKLVRPDRADDGRERNRLLREARALARLTHPNVIAVHDVGEQDGEVFIATELVAGDTLASRGGATVAWRPLVQQYAQAARGLAAAHAVGLVHRDVKPANLLVGADGRVRVADFGLAVGGATAALPHAATEAAGSAATAASRDPDRASALRVTRTGAIAGTPAYMAPEQRAGQVVEAPADQYALCVALAEAIAGRRPPLAPAADTLLAFVCERRTPEPGLDQLCSVIARGLALEPAARFTTMTALADELDAIAAPTAASSTELASRGGARSTARAGTGSGVDVTAPTETSMPASSTPASVATPASIATPASVETPASATPTVVAARRRAAGAAAIAVVAAVAGAVTVWFMLRRDAGDPSDAGDAPRAARDESKRAARDVTDPAPALAAPSGKDEVEVDDGSAEPTAAAAAPSRAEPAPRTARAGASRATTTPTAPAATAPTDRAITRSAAATPGTAEPPRPTAERAQVTAVSPSASPPDAPTTPTTPTTPVPAATSGTTLKDVSAAIQRFDGKGCRAALASLTGIDANDARVQHAAAICTMVSGDCEGGMRELAAAYAREGTPDQAVPRVADDYCPLTTDPETRLRRLASRTSRYKFECSAYVAPARAAAKVARSERDRMMIGSILSKIATCFSHRGACDDARELLGEAQVFIPALQLNELNAQCR